MALPSDYREMLVKKLGEKGVRSDCELCGQNNWSVVDQAVSVQVTDLSGSFTLPPPQIPAGAFVCNHCGNIRLLALGALGLLPVPEGAEPDER